MTKARARKKVEIAIDKIVDLQDSGFGSELVALKTTRLLEALNSLWNEIEYSTGEKL